LHLRHCVPVLKINWGCIFMPIIELFILILLKLLNSDSLEKEEECYEYKIKVFDFVEKGLA